MARQYSEVNHFPRVLVANSPDTMPTYLSYYLLKPIKYQIVLHTTESEIQAHSFFQKFSFYFLNCIMRDSTFRVSSKKKLSYT